MDARGKNLMSIGILLSVSLSVCNILLQIGCNCILLHSALKYSLPLETSRAIAGKEQQHCGLGPLMDRAGSLSCHLLWINGKALWIGEQQPMCCVTACGRWWGSFKIPPYSKAVNTEVRTRSDISNWLKTTQRDVKHYTINHTLP